VKEKRAKSEDKIKMTGSGAKKFLVGDGSGISRKMNERSSHATLLGQVDEKNWSRGEKCSGSPEKIMSVGRVIKGAGPRTSKI